MEECSLVLQSSAGFFFLVLSMSAQTVTMWSNKAKCELFTQGGLKEMLVYSTAFQPILLFFQTLPFVILIWKLSLCFVNPQISFATPGFSLEQGSMNYLRLRRGRLSSAEALTE